MTDVAAATKRSGGNVNKPDCTEKGEEKAKEKKARRAGTAEERRVQLLCTKSMYSFYRTRMSGRFGSKSS